MILKKSKYLRRKNKNVICTEGNNKLVNLSAIMVHFEINGYYYYILKAFGAKAKSNKM